MYNLQRKGFRRRVRLTASEKLTPDSFRAIARDLGTPAQRASKFGFVAARTAKARQRVETHWNGSETANTAEVGDWIVTAIGANGEALRDRAGQTNVYVIKPGKFAELYEPTGRDSEHGAIYCAKGKVEAIHLSGGFEIMAPWGEVQRADDGYLLLNGDEVYGNNRETFEASYRIDG